MAYAYKKGKRIYVGYKDERGRHVQKAVHAATITEARRIGDDLERRADRVRSGIEPASPEPVPFRRLAEIYLAEAAPQKRSHRSIEGRIRIHLLPVFGDRPLHQITPGEIRSFLAQKAKEGYKPQSVEHLRLLLSAMFNYAIPEMMRGPNAAAAVPKIKIPKHEVRFFDAAEVPRLLGAVPDRWRTLFATAIYTGARQGELLGLRVRDVDLNRRMVSFARSYDGPTKSARPRTVPIPQELLPYLEQSVNRTCSEFLFPALDGTMLTAQTNLRVVLHRALVRAGIVEYWEAVCRRHSCRHEERRPEPTLDPCPKCGFRLWVRPIPPKLRFHDLRSTFGTHAYEATGDVRFVQTVLGHSDPKLTEERYSAVRNQRLLEQADRLRFGTPPPASKTDAVSYPVLTSEVGQGAEGDSTADQGPADSTPCLGAGYRSRTGDLRLGNPSWAFLKTIGETHPCMLTPRPALDFESRSVPSRSAQIRSVERCYASLAQPLG